MDSHAANSAKDSPASAKSAAVAAVAAASAKSLPARSSPVAASAKSLPARSSPAAATEMSSPAAVAAVPVPSPAPTTSSGASHTPSLDIPITPMEVEDVAYESGDVHRSSGVRDDSSVGTRRGHGSRGGRPPQPRKPKNMSKPSAAWEHFTRDESSSQDDPMAHCNYCGSAYKCHPKINGISSMLYHVNNCPKYKIHKTRQGKSQQMFTFEAKKGEGNALMIAKYDEKKIKVALTEMVIEDELPFMFVDGNGLKKFMKVVEPRFNIPSRFTTMKDCVKAYLRTKSDLKHMFMTINQRVCLTTDTWTSIQNINYMCVTAHFIDHKWTLHRRLLSFRQVSDHKGITIGRALEECLVEWGISRLLTITVDNASANDKALDWLKQRTMYDEDTICFNEFLHVRCSAHILNLIVQRGLKDAHDSIERVRNVVRYVKSSPKRLERFKSCADRQKVVCQASLVLDVPTRWNSTYSMLEVAEKYRRAFELLQEEDGPLMRYLNRTVGGRKGLGPPKEDDWNNVRHFVHFLKVFYDVTMKISGSLYSTANLFFQQLCSARRQVLNYAGSPDPLVSAMARQMKVKYDKYWENFEKINRLLFVAVVLDPRYKLVAFEYWCQMNLSHELAKNLVDKLKEDLNNIFDQYVGTRGNVPMMSVNDEVQSREAPHCHASTSSENVSFDDDADFLSEFHSFQASRNLMDCKTEIEQYCLEDVESPSTTFDILNWWKVNSTKFPILSKVARDVLAIPVTTVASESTFSTGGRVLDPFRSSLAPKTVEALVCTQNWLRSSPVSLRDTFLSKVDDGESYKLDLEIMSNIINVDEAN
ncbi:zinc finger BED domain-containing protein RICESLEEPER 2-like [Corylus avellana]|uniref:zinc finger BED domain-containing protein RICESLEEPER 2-like n=1 Tax=Corylus avellana TaxID=13451 RepID=UPI00286CBAF8|nr:zinc finger BED domain-containing protein RICESLEEPER 2-like [Corylus avellana]